MDRLQELAPCVGQPQKPRPHVSVIVPTYCERENLAILVPRIHEALAQTSAEIIIVDDDSPDGTPDICDELSDFYDVRLIVRKGERGLSSAVLEGMRCASGEILVVVDADLSHPPESIPDLVAAMAQGDADFVIGSRYVQGGSTAEDWGFLRWLNSKVATLLARPLTSAKDPMAGFIALRRSSFEKAEKFLDPVGYKIGLELIVKCRCQKVFEVPISFSNRLHGKSKLTLREQINYLRHLGKLYNYHLRDWYSLRRSRLEGN